jgi:branched-chain amino acid transport system substrate-binding protein
MTRRKPLIVLLLAVLLLAGCGPVNSGFECTDAIGCVDISPGEPIKIGSLQALTGDLALQGVELLQATQLALDDRGGKLLDHPLLLQSADSQCSAEGGTTAILKITADPQIVGILGPSCSSAAASAAKVVADAGLVMISSSSSSASLTSVGGSRGPDWQPGFFRTAQNDALSGRVAATFAFEELGVIRAATIDDGGQYSRGLTDTFKQVFTELGGNVVLGATINKGDINMEPVLTAVAASGAELLFFVVFPPEGDHIVLQAWKVDALENVTLMTAEGLYFDSFIQAVGEAGRGVYFNAPAPPQGPAYDAFVAQYEAKYAEPPTATPYHAHAYDAANLLFGAIEAVAVKEDDGTLHIGRQALRDALYSNTGYQGLTGSLTCDKCGDCGAIRLQVTRLDNPAAGLEGLQNNVIYFYSPDR